MDDDQKAKSLPGDFRKSFEALAHPGESNERSPVTKWRSLVHDAIKYLMNQTAELNEKLFYLTEWLNTTENHLKQLDPVEISDKTVEVAIAKLEPGPDDVVIFWLPAESTVSQVRGVYNDFSAIIGSRFNFLVLIRQSVDIEIISGKKTKGGVLLPS